ncbi:MAG: lipopolysaccharide heptosyltransferase II [Phycisphaerae bacterium]
MSLALTTPPRRVLIIKPSSLGDVATTMPLLCDLRAEWPTTEFDWLIAPGLTDLLRGHYAISELIPFERKQLSGWPFRASAWASFTGLVRKLRARHYDIAIDAQGLARSAWLARLSGARVRIGFADARELAPLLYTHTAPAAAQALPAVARMRRLRLPLDITPADRCSYRVPVTAAALELARAQTGHQSYIAVIPGARWNTKRWPTAKYVALIQALANQALQVVLLGSPDERALCTEIAQQANAGVLNLAGQTDLAGMIALLKLADLVIGNDSGPLHVAVALGRPVVGIYGPTDPNYVGPYDQLDHVVRHPVPCHPCRRKECDHHSCMNLLEFVTVWAKIEQVIMANNIRTGK